MPNSEAIEDIMRLKRFVILTALLALPGCGRTTPVAEPIPGEPVPGNAAIDGSPHAGVSLPLATQMADRPIGVDDVLEIQVFDVAELSRTVRVSPDGHISYPLLGAVMAEGRTPRELEVYLEDALRGKYLREPHVTIEIKTYGTPPVYVIGEVVQPGAFVPDRSGLTAVRAVALARGMKASAASKRVVLIRGDAAGNRVQHTLNMDEILKGKAPDIALESNDVVYIPKHSEKVIVQGTIDALLRVVSFRGIF